jgi:hypothetical protein
MVVILLASGCSSSSSSDCKPNTYRCNGKAVEFCDSDGTEKETPYYWHSQASCTTACRITSDGVGVCIDSTQPISECAGRKATCWNGKQTSCYDGYPSGTKACDASTCVLTDACDKTASCVLGTTPDARCTPGTPSGDCAGDTAVQCWCGYLTSSMVCGAGKCSLGICLQ